MTVLFVTDERFLDHDAGVGHPERPERLRAVQRGLTENGLDEALTARGPRRAGHEEITRVHTPELVAHLASLAQAGGGRVDADTALGPNSFDVAALAAGAVLSAVEGLEGSEHSAAWCAVRPPGHHATRGQAMGFCLFNSVAVAAAALVARGERVAVVDLDAHHGNGTQEIFYEDPRVLYVSLHQWPLYPGTGALEEAGSGAAVGTTVNVPLPRGTTGDTYRRALAEIVAPAVEGFDAGWLLVSTGFDAHRRDPLTGLELSSGDFADLAADLSALVGRGRAVFVLEGGYDLDAVASCTAATVAALVGQRHHPEAPTTGGTGNGALDAAIARHRRGRT